jgi:chemotaxis-related protein WspB
MRVLKFQVGRESFAVDCRRIVEVTPLPRLRPLPHAPAYLAGLLHFRGRVVPVVDLKRLLGGEAAEPRLSTRVLLVEPAPGRSLIGLLVERVSDLVEATAERTISLTVPQAPYLGPVVECNGELLQLLAVEHLVSPAVLRELATSSAESS